MLFLPVQESCYLDAICEAGHNCPDGTRVLAWVNYLKEIGIKRYYLCEKYQQEWYQITVDVFPHDTTIWWNVYSRSGLYRNSYVNATYHRHDDYNDDYDNDSVVVNIEPDYTEEVV